MNNSSNINDKRFLDLLQKWQSGDFTRADEVEMNQLTRNDPFLKEAAEGYYANPELDHEAVLEALRNKVRGKKGVRRVMFPQWLALAAALCLILAAVWFVNGPSTELKEEGLADNRALSTDSASEPEEAENIESKTAREEPAVTAVQSAPVEDQAGVASTSRDRQLESVHKAMDQSIGNLDDKEADIQSDELAMSETSGMEKSQGAGEYAAKPDPQPSRSQSTAKQSSAKKRPVESAPAGYQKDDAYKSEEAAAQVNQPVGGWDTFRNYLSNKARLTPSAQANNITGTVRMQFELDASKKPVKFLVIKALGYGCDEAAMNLIKEYKWEGPASQPILVDIPFIR
ncbi:MAG: energy transducer TonB [Saprospiraceae bacterium]